MCHCLTLTMNMVSENLWVEGVEINHFLIFFKIKKLFRDDQILIRVILNIRASLKKVWGNRTKLPSIFQSPLAFILMMVKFNLKKQFSRMLQSEMGLYRRPVIAIVIAEIASKGWQIKLRKLRNYFVAACYKRSLLTVVWYKFQFPSSPFTLSVS